MNISLISFIDVVILLITLRWKESGVFTEPAEEVTPQYLTDCRVCTIKKYEPSKVIDCRDKDLPHFPTDCPADLQIFDMSHASCIPAQYCFNYISDHNYSKVVKMFLRWINKNDTDSFITVKPDTFSTFLSVEEIDLSHTRIKIEGNGSIIWPPKLKILSITGCKLKELSGLNVVKTLEELNAAGNNLRALPKLHENSSIYRIDLRDNPLDTVDVSIIAPLCELSHFSIKVTGNGTLNKPKGYCHCLRLNKWIKMTKLEGDEKLICNGGHNNKEDSCEDELIFSSSILDAYDKCLEEGPTTSLLELLLFALFFSVLFPIMYFAYEGYNKLTAPKDDDKSFRKKRRTNDSESTYDFEEEWEEESHLE